MKRAVGFSAIALGFTAMAGQIVFIRELLIVFHGSELSIGFILGSWLIGGAIGSGIFGRLSDKIRRKTAVFAFFLMALGALLPLDIFIIRSLRMLAGINAGEVVPLAVIAASSLAVLVPICAIMGFLFSLACSMYKAHAETGAEGISRIYVYEAIGAIAGGLITSFLLVRLFDSLHNAAAFGFIDLAAALLIIYSQKDGRKYLIAIFTVTLAVLWLLAWPLGLWQNLASYSIKRQWEGQHIIAYANSIYGNIVLSRIDSQYTFFENGLRLYTVPDRLSREEAIHYPMLEHADPKEVLLVGGGAGGLVSEITRYDIDRCDYVELDPLIIEKAEDFLPAEYTRAMNDPRVSIKITDGRSFIKTTGERYDCIIMNLGDPYTAQIARYYTLEFFREAERILKDGGIISFGLSSSENYINPEQAQLLRSIYTTLGEVFRDIKVVPGDTAFFLATNGKEGLTYDYKVLMKRMADRKIILQYVREYYLFSKLSSERIKYIEDILSKRGVINYDFRPIATYLETVSWSTRFKDSFVSRALKAASPEAIRFTIFAACAAILFFGVAARGRKRGFERSVLVSMAALGFSSISAQLVILLAFQVIYGYLFYKIGIILTSFMIGLAAGGWLAARFLSNLCAEKNLFIKIHAVLTAFVFSLPLSLLFISRSAGSASSWIGSSVFFPYISAAAGFIGGFQFPVAAKIYLGAQGAHAGKGSGIVYGMDLLGSCIGAIFTGAFLIPVLGLGGACCGIGVIDLSCLLALIFLSSR